MAKIKQVYGIEARQVLSLHYNDLSTVMVKQPCNCVDKPQKLSNVITHLNDTEGWSREAIADWLESLGY